MPVAIMYISVIGDRFLDCKYALAEAARSYRLLRKEDEGYIVELARGEFGWDIRRFRRELDGQIYAFELSFLDYLRARATGQTS